MIPRRQAGVKADSTTPASLIQGRLDLFRVAPPSRRGRAAWFCPVTGKAASLHSDAQEEHQEGRERPARSRAGGQAAVASRPLPGIKRHPATGIEKNQETTQRRGRPRRGRPTSPGGPEGPERR